MSKPPKCRDVVYRDILIEHSIHQQKLSRVASRIDNGPPKKMTHVAQNSKGKYLELSKKKLILSSNRILVDKLMQVSSRENSTYRPRKSAISLKKPRKIEEISRITTENFRILNKIKTSRPHYSSEKLKREYRFSSTLRKMISRNAGRVPKILNFTQVDFLNKAEQNHSTRTMNNTMHFDFLS